MPVYGVGAVVVEPVAACGQVAEAQRASGRGADHGAPATVRALPQRVREGVPVVEVADYGYGPGGLVGRQGEGDADGTVADWLRYLDHLTLHVNFLILRDWGDHAVQQAGAYPLWPIDIMFA